MTVHRHAVHPHEKPHHPHWPLAALLFAAVFFLAFFSVHEPATWVHLKTGAWILAEKAVPRADPFSYTMSGQPWSTDSWLADVLMTLADRAGGPALLGGLKAAALALAFALLLPLNPAAPIVAATLLLLAAACAWPGFTELPSALDFLGLALMIRLLRPRRRFHWRWAASVVALELAWANLHGGGAVLGLWLVLLKCAKASLRAEKPEGRRHLALLALCGAALALNPHGPAVVARTFAAAPAFWPESSGVAAFAAWAAFAAAGLAACWICLQQEFFLSLTAATVIALSVLRPEHRPLAAFAACPALALAAGHWLRPVADTPARVWRWALGAAALCAAHALCVYRPLAPARGYGAVTLRGALDFLDARAVRGRLFNEIDAGAAIIGQSDRPVFVDGRRVLYGAAFSDDAAAWRRSFATLAEVYRFDYAVLANRRADGPAPLETMRGWRRVYADDQALVYVRLGTAGGWIADSRRPLLQPQQLWPDVLDELLRRPGERERALIELDRWVAAAPRSAQALLWKAYALDRLNRGREADFALSLARRSPVVDRDPELLACLGSVYEGRERWPDALSRYRWAARLARRRHEHRLEARLLERLAALHRRLGQPEKARPLERRQRALAALGD